MRKLLTFATALFLTGSLLAGGVVTNTNQSASWVRLPSRNASIAIDAAYFNPAGLMKLENGLHVSLSNQSIWQTREVENSYLGPFDSFGLNEHLYKGSAKAPVFPSIYGVYKMDKLAISLGFNPIGGGGGATYDMGLPSFEMSISDLVPLVSGLGIPTTQYSADIYFEGTSVFFGYQANIAYEINDMISAAIGARLVTAKNNYNGYIKTILINPTYAGNPTGAMMSAPAFFTSVGQAAYAAMTADREVDVEQTGTGFVPILSLNIAPSEKLNLAIKYEFKTKLELTTKVNDNKGGGIFIDGEKTASDMPAMLSFGLDYRLLSNLKLSLGSNYYFDKAANYGHKIDDDMNPSTPTVPISNSEIIDDNGFSIQGGLELNLSEKLLVSGGYIWSNKGVNSKYQSDLTNELATQTFGAGGAYSFSDKFQINLGAGYVLYKKDEVTIDHVLPSTPPLPLTAQESYLKNTFMVAVGFDINF